MKGRIGFERHEIQCRIGVTAEERERTQPIFVDLKVEVDLTRAVESDDFVDAVDYAAMAQLCTEVATRKQYQLIEKYAGDVLRELLAHFNILEAWICVRKPNALPTAACSLVELSLKRSEE